MDWLKKRLKSKTIWLTSIAPTVLAFLSLYSNEAREVLNGYYPHVIMVFGALAWGTREKTNSSLDDK